jgi:alkanesulfonate monooxygenase SsuD/methylene tetrahydromethanopterin reductase-like flavin-dependent oxidoreductase (luciferase family)
LHRLDRASFAWRTGSWVKDIVRPNLKKGMDRANRKGCEILLIRICAVNTDPMEARRLARHAIAFYSVLPYYDIVLTPLGFSSQAQAIREAFGRGDFQAMVQAVSDEMVAALAFAGTRDDIRYQARQFEGLVDAIILSSPYFGVSLEETRANHSGMVQIFAA